MSLEQVIQENTAAIRDLILAIKQSGAVASNPAVVVQPAPVPPAVAKAFEEVAKAAPAPAPKAEAPKPAPAAGGEDLRKEVRDLIFRLDKEVSRSAALDALKKADAPNVKSVPDDKLQLVKDAALALLKENESAAA